ncbi:hypothetical protein COCNU_scaffold009617G000040 [Cocos nucifera]|nr:hypothetical protein [Cocos nucifera]
MRVPPQKDLITEEALYDAELGSTPSIGMRLPLRISKDEVRQFATQKRVASGARLSHVLKKSRATGPSIATASADAPLATPFGAVSAHVVVLHAPAAATSSKAPLAITRSEKDVVIIDVPIVAPMSGVQPTIAASAPRSTMVRRGRLLSPSTPECMSVPPEQSSAKKKGKALVFSVPTRSDAFNHGYTNFERVDVRVPEGGSTFLDLQLARSLVHAILLPNDRESRRSRILANLFGSFYPTFIRIS